ncbi:outer membrane beta-barrel protein [Maribacter polysaccharolyticus]|uniref:outer membrane beta-barrel protein n=1 Tax=Maribacter polysaccharolyticus TaxID=3020831 RepID=UPI00237F1ECE|nr:outer membrane beta-barrel protein [Maribacter polysaccharolyticus]MDE3740864.1 outer membrane beta-barrel protein [Maribacter polysaccharolyticus]
MKKLLPITTIFLLLFTTNMFAQRWYVRAGGGYSGEFAKTEFNNTDPNGITGIEQSTKVTVNDDGTATIESLNGTVGAGYKFFVTGGYMFNDYFGAEMGLNYFKGDETSVGQLTTSSVQSKATTYIEGVDLNPGIYLTPKFPKLNPYLRAGFLLTVGGTLTIDTEVLQIDGGGDGTDILVNAESEVKSKFSVGYTGAFGVTYPINDKFSIFGEWEFKSFTIKSKSAEIKKYTTFAVTDGQSSLVSGEQLEDLTTYEKEFIFSDSYTESLTTEPNEDEPREIPTQYVNASGMGFNLGVRYSF